MINRQTLVVGSTAAWHVERFRAAADGRTGLQICTFRQMAERLAGGFLRAARHDELESAAALALITAKPALRELASLVELPGTARALCRTLGAVWESGLDLCARPDSARFSDLAKLEAAVIANLPRNAVIPRDLVAAALVNVDWAPKLLGPILVSGVYAVSPCWRSMVASVAQSTEMTWETIEGVDEWIADMPIKVIRREANIRTRAAVTCADPKHEIVEALRWVRELITSGRAAPHEIAIAAASSEAFDDYLRTAVHDSQLPIHFASGTAALSDFAGQQAAAVAEVLLHGISQDRVLRAVRLLRSNHPDFEGLPTGWHRWFKSDAPLLSIDHWRRELERIDREHTTGIGPILLSFVQDVSRGLSLANAIGERWLKGPARSIWRRALLEGPPQALATTLTNLRVTDETDPAASVLWGPAAVVCSVPRRHVRLLGMSSRAWPRNQSDDPLLPEHILGRRVAHISVPDLDRIHFHVLMAHADEVIFSRSRRDGEGRLLGTSPLYPRDIEAERLRRTRVPVHAFSYSDRLLARPAEFAQSALAVSAEACFVDRNRIELTPHDGIIRGNHPVIEAALGRVQSASSLRLLLRDPIGFVWKYALRFSQPKDANGEEPVLLDDLSLGDFIHKVLEHAVLHLERDGGFAGASADQISQAVSRATIEMAAAWELEAPVPPRSIWQSAQNKTREIAVKALTFPQEPLVGARSFVEVPFGTDECDLPPERLPWDPTRQVTLPNTNVRISGRIDRLDLSGNGVAARVTDYKTVGGLDLRDDPGLNNGKELQRAIYASVVKALLPDVQEIEAALLYPHTDRIFNTRDAASLVAEIVAYLNAAMDLIRDGNAVPGIGAEDDYNQMRFALPSNAVGLYFARKAQARNERVQPLLPLWGM